MCRVLAYLGKSILLDDLFYKTDNSLVKQSYHPRMMKDMLNLAGFGFAAWNRESVNPHLPFYYRIHSLPFYDKNLKHLALKIQTTCLLSHIRGIRYHEENVVSDQNCHPFKFPNSPLAFAHNGSLVGYEDMLTDLNAFIFPKYRKYIHGTTDSEYLYALFLSCMDKIYEEISMESVFSALTNTLKVLDKIRKKNKMAISSPLNFIISNGEFIVASRFVFDYGQYSEDDLSPHRGYHSMWYTYGEAYNNCDGSYQMKASKSMQSIIVASEPLTEDTTTWIELPEYSFIGAKIVDKQLVIRILDVVI